MLSLAGARHKPGHRGVTAGRKNGAARPEGKEEGQETERPAPGGPL